MIYLDTGILVRALLRDIPQHRECQVLVSFDAVSSCHSLAETFNTLTGYYKVPNDLAGEMVGSLPEQMRFEAISQEDYLSIIQNAKARGIQGGIIYDAIHAEVARRLRVTKIITYNLKNFRHVAPDLAIEPPR